MEKSKSFQHGDRALFEMVLYVCIEIKIMHRKDAYSMLAGVPLFQEHS